MSSFRFVYVLKQQKSDASINTKFHNRYSEKKSVTKTLFITTVQKDKTKIKQKRKMEFPCVDTTDQSTRSPSTASNRYFFSEADAKDLIAVMPPRRDTTVDEEANQTGQITNTTNVTFLADCLNSLKAKIGTASDWNQLIEKHFVSTATTKSDHDGKTDSTTSIFRMCDDMELLMTLMDSQKVSRLAEEISNNNNTLLLQHQKHRHDNNNNHSNNNAQDVTLMTMMVKRRLGRDHDELQNLILQLSQKCEFVESFYLKKKFHDEFITRETDEMEDLTSNKLIGTIRAQSEALESRSKENCERMLAVLEKMKMRV